MTDLQHITAQFLGQNMSFSFNKIEEGLINSTYLVQTSHGEKYILQQVNRNVFKDVPRLMQNLRLIITTFRDWISKTNLPIKSFNYLPNLTTGTLYYKEDDTESYWRLSEFINNTPITHLSNPTKIAEESGRLFGYFIKGLSRVNLDSIYVSIPNFHDTDLYLNKLNKALVNGNSKRIKDSQSILIKLKQYEWLATYYTKIRQNKKIPIRLVHSDTKSSNILYNKDAEAIAVIDLDTCMPGYAMADFGDAIRSLTNTGKEDDLDLKRVRFDFNLFQHYTKGFLSATHDFISKEEKEALAVFALLITYEQAIRFYTDYLNDDTYYHVSYPTHNLQRTKAQLSLLNSMNEHLEDMKEFVANFEYTSSSLANS